MCGFFINVVFMFMSFQFFCLLMTVQWATSLFDLDFCWA